MDDKPPLSFWFSRLRQCCCALKSYLRVAARLRSTAAVRVPLWSSAAVPTAWWVAQRDRHCIITTALHGLGASKAPTAAPSAARRPTCRYVNTSARLTDSAGWLVIFASARDVNMRQRRSDEPIYHLLPRHATSSVTRHRLRHDIRIVLFMLVVG